MRYLFCLLLFLSLAGCRANGSAASQTAGGKVIVFDGDPDALCQWRTEAQKRFVDPVVVGAHGRTEDGQWVCTAGDHPEGIAVETLARHLHTTCPDKDIVLIVCNEDGHEIHVPRVWYAKHIVWMRPTGTLYPWEQQQRKRNSTVGDIWQFVN